jgi:hypothetical protein
MERELEGISVHHKAAPKFLRRVAKSVCRYYGVPQIAVSFINKPKTREFGYTLYSDFPDASPTRLVLNGGFHGQNLMTLLHELAHHITDCLYDDAQAHGPEFCAIYMHLMSRHKILPQDCFRVLAARWKVRIAHEYLPSAFT